MSVTIPSDLILDVMRNAPSNKLAQSFTGSKFESASPVITGESFVDVAEGLVSPVKPKTDLIAGVLEAADIGQVSSAEENLATRGKAPVNPQAAFEQMFLRSVFETMLPQTDSGIYGGESASSGVWRSLAADHLASAYAEAGGLGIASKLNGRSPTVELVGMPQWPYFQQAKITSFAV